MLTIYADEIKVVKDTNMIVAKVYGHPRYADGTEACMTVTDKSKDGFFMTEISTCLSNERATYEIKPKE